VEALAANSSASVEQIGTSLEGRPIQLATIGTGPTEVWLVGRQHGDEPTGAEAILLALETLADPDATLPSHAPASVQAMAQHRETLLDRLTIHAVPVGNPDGAAAYQRSTATGYDPNRDHFLFAHPFSQALREAFWQRKPDACLDLHNEGVSDTDFDAFGAEGPLMESENYGDLRDDASLAVREVDAAGGNAGSYNENYRAPIAEEHPNPTALHPGTHDLFCTTRGAPGWTPEGAIEGGDNGATSPDLAWATRLHHVTIAAHALHQAGVYDAATPHVAKTAGDGPAASETVQLDEPGEATFRAVWRETPTGSDHNPTPTRFTVTTPDGDTLEGRTPHPEAWTSTVNLDEAPAGEYTLSLTGAIGEHELRTYTQTSQDPLVTVERTDTGLRVSAANASAPVQVALADVADEADATPQDFAPAAERVTKRDGTVDERLTVQFTLSLEPGETVAIDEPEALDERGPYRYTATSGSIVDAGVEDAFNPAPDT